MTYTKENFQDWIFAIADKMAVFTTNFAQENQLILDYSLHALDHLERWILNTYEDEDQLIADHHLLDLLGIYIGETFRKHIGGTWFMDTENKKMLFICCRC